MAAPPSQRYRQIGFYLTGGGLPPAQMDLPIRPEDLTRQEPSRLTTQSTLGGAWADAFGRGLATINISGTTGWRGGFVTSGEDAFNALRDIVYVGWHDRRDAAAARGIDPATVELVFSDSLDGISSIVAPKTFVLKRSKTSPLLCRFQIQLTELGDASDPGSILDEIISAFSNPVRWLAGVTGLGGVLSAVEFWAGKAMSVFGAVSAGIGVFINTGTMLLQSVTSAIQSVEGQFDSATSSIVTLSQGYFSAAANAFYALAGDPTLSEQDRIPVRAIASSFNDASCILATSINPARSYPSWDDLFGASACSSTGGGEPASLYTLSATNPFYDMLPTPPAPVTVSTASAQAISVLLDDPIVLLASGSVSVATLMGTAGSGVFAT